MLAVKMPRKDVVEIINTDIPIPGKGEVLIQMKASALCRSDLHVLHRSELLEDDEFDITPGHEPSGVVVTLGPNVEKVKVGDRVAIYLGIGCNECEHCLRGDMILCKQYKCISQHVNGAHADFMVVPEETCLPMPDDMDFITAALSTDVGGTLYTACKRLGVNGSKLVAIFGVGPMGLGGVLFAKAMGGTVIAIDMNQERLDLSKQLGADYIINTGSEDLSRAIEIITNNEGVDVCIVCVGANQAINDALNITKVRGHVGFIGETSKATINPSGQLMRKLLEVHGCWYFNKSDWKEICNIIQRKKIPLSSISTRTFKLSEAITAFELFDSGNTQKVVFTWE